MITIEQKIILFQNNFAFPVSSHNSLHVIFSLVSGITPDLQVDRRGSIP